MRKYVKTGLLIITLAFPVLVFLFLKVFTTNHYDLPYFVPLRDVAANVIVQPNGDTTFYQIPDFSFQSIGESTLSAATLKGKTLLVSTLKSPCDDTCGKVLSQLARVQALHDTYPEFVMLTIVGGGDDKLISELKKYNNSSAGWQVAVVPDSTLDNVVRHVFRLAEKVPEMQTIPPSARLSLVDGSGHIRGYYDTTDPEETDRLMAEIRILEHNREQM